MIPLLPLVAILLATTLAGSTIGAVAIILAALILRRGDRLLWTIAVFYFVSLTALDAAQNGADGFISGLRNTWTILLLPATAGLATREAADRSVSALLYGFLLAAGVYLYFCLTSDPAVHGNYGFHSAPYVFAVMLLAPSWIAMSRPRVGALEIGAWLVLAVAIFMVNTRGVILAWLGGTILFIALFPRERRFPRRFIALLGLLIVLFGAWKASRWQVADLANQPSIQHRFAIWGQVISQFEERPIFGYGFDRFLGRPEEISPQYRNYLQDQTNPHSGYLMALHAGGMFGFLIVWSAYAAVFYMLIRKLRRQGTSAISLVSACCMAAMMIGAFADKTFFMTLPALQQWFLAGLALSEDPEGDEGTVEP